MGGSAAVASAAWDRSTAQASLLRHGHRAQPVAACCRRSGSAIGIRIGQPRGRRQVRQSERIPAKQASSSAISPERTAAAARALQPSSGDRGDPARCAVDLGKRATRQELRDLCQREPDRPGRLRSSGSASGDRGNCDRMHASCMLSARGPHTTSAGAAAAMPRGSAPVPAAAPPRTKRFAALHHFHVHANTRG